ncbi:MAG: alginate export family protein [Gammaproteobacteria bacterium]
MFFYTIKRIPFSFFSMGRSLRRHGQARRKSEKRCGILFGAFFLLIKTAFAGTESVSDSGQMASASLSSKIAAPNNQNNGNGALEPYDPNAPPKTTTPIGPYLSFGGQAKLKSETNRNYLLEGGAEDAFSIFRPELSLAFSFHPDEHLQIYANTILKRPVAFEESINKHQETELDLNLAFLSLKNIVEGAGFYLGRQRFIDPRRWLFNDSLDAARLTYQFDRFSFEVSASRKKMFEQDFLNGESTSSSQNFINYYSYINYKLDKKTDIGFFALYQDDQTSTDEHPIFLGIQSEGEIRRHLDYWFQGAIVRGTDSAKKIRGKGVDLGLTYGLGGALKPSFTVGYAYGSGDSDSSDNIDTAFRQSGFQDNEDKFNGVTRLRYYGEVMDPRLINLSVFTGGIGMRPSRRTSFDLVYHYFLQEFPSKRIRGADINANPDGLHKDIGSELDFIAGYREIKNLDTNFILGYFWPGGAFPETSNGGAFLGKIELRYSF